MTKKGLGLLSGQGKGDYPAVEIRKGLSLKFFALLVILAAVLVDCGGTTTPPPTIDAAAIFLQNCYHCHGIDREGIIGPSLKAEALRERGRSDTYIRETITNGRGGMPAWKDTLSPAEIEALIKFLRS
ncbi:MAG: cytochrome c [Chloroflexi bacterium]|nr:cytochrome c [Chloroflexota bacterium]